MRREGKIGWGTAKSSRSPAPALLTPALEMEEFPWSLRAAGNSQGDGRNKSCIGNKIYDANLKKKVKVKYENMKVTMRLKEMNVLWEVEWLAVKEEYCFSL